VRALGAAMETKDQYTAEHAESLALMAIAVGRELGLSDADLRLLEYAALLHDIGKIGVPGEILNKPDQLNDEEFAEIAKHTLLGEHISSQVDDLKPVARIIRSAHERWDGKGYPDGLRGEDIPLLARILLVCDAYHAMTSDRPYRKALAEDIALAELRQHAGTQFDPDVVHALCHVWETIGRMSRGEAPAMPIYIWNRPRGAGPQIGPSK
jgi:putative nucleotidyltransferase with HDIG domain